MCAEEEEDGVVSLANTRGQWRHHASFEFSTNCSEGLAGVTDVFHSDFYFDMFSIRYLGGQIYIYFAKSYFSFCLFVCLFCSASVREGNIVRVWFY